MLLRSLRPLCTSEPRISNALRFCWSRHTTTRHRTAMAIPSCAVPLRQRRLGRQGARGVVSSARFFQRASPPPLATAGFGWAPSARGTVHCGAADIARSLLRRVEPRHSCVLLSVHAEPTSRATQKENHTTGFGGSISPTMQLQQLQPVRCGFWAHFAAWGYFGQPKSRKQQLWARTRTRTWNDCQRFIGAATWALGFGRRLVPH